MDDGVEEIQDEAQKDAVGKNAVKVYMASMVSALILTLFFTSVM